MKNLLQIGKKVLTGFLLTAIIVVTFYAPITARSVPQAHAVIPVTDAAQIAGNEVFYVAAAAALVDIAANTTADAGFDFGQLTIMNILNGIAWQVAKAAVQSITRSIVNWINSGFQGSPAFETDLKQGLLRLSDTVARQFLSEIGSNIAIQSPFLQRLVGAVGTGYLLYSGRDVIRERLRYTLGQYTQNARSYFAGDFREGGWDAWHATTLTCGNDPYCSAMATRDELANRIDEEVRQRLEELDWGNGFLSWRGDCISQSGGGEESEGETTAATAETDTCTEYSINTPGSIIEDQLAHVLGSGVRQLELADSINEIVGALVSQLVTQVIGATGLLGSTQPQSGGGRSVLSGATDMDSNASTTDRLSSGFDEVVRTERTSITGFQTNWRSIKTSADAANAQCVSAGGAALPASKSTVDAAVASANEQLRRAAETLATLERLLARIAEIRAGAAAGQSLAIQQVSDEYNELLRSGTSPRPDEVAQSRTQSRNDSILQPPSLKYQLETIVAAECK